MAGKKGPFDPVYYANIILQQRQPFATFDDTKEMMRYADGVYYPAETEVENDAQILLNEWHKEEIEIEIKDKESGKKGVKYETVKFREIPSKYKINEIKSYLKIQTYTPRTWFDFDLNIINLKNGLYDIDKGVLKEHTPDYHSVIQIPIEFDPEADCPSIRKFLSEVLHESDIPIVQEMFGYCLYRQYHIAKVFMLLGEGANGKSTLINLLNSLLGEENISSVSLQSIGDNRFAVANLYGKMANMFADLSPKALRDTGIIKMLSGNDLLYAEKKGKDPFKFKNYAKLINSANQLPKVYDNTNAFFRRIILLNFPNQFPENDENTDADLIEKLTTDKELSGLFNFAIKGLERLLSNGHFSYSMTADQVREDYQRKSSPVAAFVQDCIALDSDSWVYKEDAFNQFRDYCHQYKLPPISSIAFNRDELPKLVPGLKDGGRKGPKGKQKTSWAGIKLLPIPIPATDTGIPATEKFGSGDGSGDVLQLKIETGTPLVAGVGGMFSQSASKKISESNEPELDSKESIISSKLGRGNIPTTPTTGRGDLDK